MNDRTAVSSRIFISIGLSIIDQNTSLINLDTTFHLQKIYVRRNMIKKCELESYKAHFGVSPLVTKAIWMLLFQHNILPKGGLPVHLLWSLMFLKIYSSAKVLASIAGCSVKTYSKWTWQFVKSIAKLKGHVVGVIYIYILFLVL